MSSIVERLKQEYPLMQVVDSETNSSISVKFARYGTTDMDVWTAIKDGPILELYDNQGAPRGILELRR